MSRTPSVRGSSRSRAASGTSISASTKRPSKSIFGHAAPTSGRGLDRVDERPQPARLDRGVVVDEGDVVELARAHGCRGCSRRRSPVLASGSMTRTCGSSARTRSTTSSSEPLSTITISRRSAGQSVASSDSRQSIVICQPSKLMTTTRTKGAVERGHAGRSVGQRLLCTIALAPLTDQAPGMCTSPASYARYWRTSKRIRLSQ